MFSVDKRVERDPLLGTTIAKQFELIERLGSGSLSVVYKGRHVKTGRIHAIKFLKHDTGDDELARTLFERELTLTNNLVHPNIASIIDSGVMSDGTPFLVLDYINGPSLSQMLEKTGPISPYAAVKIIAEICQGMSYAHSKGVVHRDLKPSNIMIHQDNATSVVKVIDFGIAKLLDSDGCTMGLTGNGQLLGSLCYMSPERLQRKAIDERHDIYALGCLMYELLTGEPPVVSDDPQEIVRAHLSGLKPETIITKLSANKPSVIRDSTYLTMIKILDRYDQIVATCLAKDPLDRYESMMALKTDVEQVTSKQQLNSGRLKSTVTRTAVQWDKTRAKKSAQRSIVVYAMAAAAFTLIVLLAFFLMNNGGTAMRWLQ